MIDDIAQWTTTDLTAALREEELSVREVATTVLDRIDRVDPDINAWVTVDHAAVLQQASRLDAQVEMRSRPLFGVPVAIKDLTVTAGTRTTFGSLRFKDHVPNEDALIVRRLREAGALIVGKTNTPEFGVGGNTVNEVAGPTRNPWDPMRSAGGSSGGSAAALASGTCVLAQGSDTGGSLRIPAAFCGTIGFRTSIGLVPDAPANLAWDTLSVTGPMARTIDDVDAMLTVVAGAALDAPLSQLGSVEAMRARRFAAPVRVGWSVGDDLCPVEGEVERALHGAVETLEQLGCVVNDRAPDLRSLETPIQVMRGARQAAIHGDALAQHRDRMHPGLVDDIVRGQGYTAVDLVKAELARGAVYSRVSDFWNDTDVLVMPTTPIPPFPLAELAPMRLGERDLHVYSEWMILTHAVTLMGWPALAVPSTPSRDRLPIGVQLIARPGYEWALLDLARGYEEAMSWTRIAPASRVLAESEGRGRPLG
jgi:amidase